MQMCYVQLLVFAVTSGHYNCITETFCCAHFVMCFTVACKLAVQYVPLH